MSTMFECPFEPDYVFLVLWIGLVELFKYIGLFPTGHIPTPGQLRQTYLE